MHEWMMGEKEQEHLKAELIFAKKLGLIDDDTPDWVRRRCQMENQKRKEQLRQGRVVYGMEQFPLPAYVRYEQTRFQLAFVSESKAVKEHYTYRTISEEEKQAFYEANKDLFTRYHGDCFSYEEVAVIIRKRIREIEYEKEIHNLLCQLDKRQ